MLKKTTMALAAVLTLAAAAVQAQEARDGAPEGSWIHVRVAEADGAEVDVNLPLSLIDVALELGEEKGLDADDLRFGPDSDVSMEDLRRMWRGLRDAGDGEFVDVEDGGEHVRVYKQGDRVRVDIDEDGVEKVRVDMPASIVDALLGSEGDRLDLRAAARELARAGDREVVRIDDEGTQVRVWVDRQSGGVASGT